MSKTRKLFTALLASVFAFSLSFAVVGLVSSERSVSADPESEETFVFNVTDYDTQVVGETTAFGTDNFFYANATEEKNFIIDGNDKGSSEDRNLKFHKRLKSGDKSVGTDRTISFYLEKQAEIVVYAMSASSSGTGRYVALYKNGVSASLDKFEVQTNADSGITPYRFHTTLAGGYYFAFEGGGINVYYISVTYTGEADPVDRENWEGVSAPSLLSAQTSADGLKIDVKFTAEIGDDGADYVMVYMYADGDPDPVAERRYFAYGAYTATKPASVSFTPTSSSTFTFKAIAYRASEATSKESVEDVSEEFELILAAPAVRAKTVPFGDSVTEMTLEVGVTQVYEGSYYEVYLKKGGETVATETLTGDGTLSELLWTVPVKLDIGATYEYGARSVREEPSATTDYSTGTAVVRNEAERDWIFKWFGNSTNEAYNVMVDGGNIYDGLTLKSCTFNENTGAITKKGGKFTKGGHDGISYYYTQVKADEEDFVLRATITVDYLNTAIDGQEGFALLIRDAVPETSNANAYYYSNSFAAIGSKIDPPDMKGLSDGIGSRAVTGIGGDDSMTALEIMTTQPDTKKLSSIDRYFQPELPIARYQSYTFEVEKKNNCYYARYYNRAGVLIRERKLFHMEYDEDDLAAAQGEHDASIDGKYDHLRQIDKEYVYVGFAVARGCNATFSDITFSAYARNDEYIEISPDPFIPEYSIVSPEYTSIPQYNFKFYTTADGYITVYNNCSENEAMEGTATPVIEKTKVNAFEYYNKIVLLTEEINHFYVVYDADDDYVSPFNEPLEYWDPVLTDRMVIYKNYQVKNGEIAPIYCAPVEDTADIGVVGSPTNDGSMTSPLDIQSAIHYVYPGQTVYMLAGVYEYTDGNLTVQKGNDGKADALKTLASFPANATRPVIDFKEKGAGFTLWGDYWHLYGFDITRSANAKKGLQVGGHYCIVESINAYSNGDTGIQISGKSADTYDVWPSNNLILNCTSYNNRDIAEEDADGFGAKLYCAEGNVFRGCMSYCNIDDGWDLFAKTESGRIGAVTIENCLAFGNGFYLGSDDPDSEYQPKNPSKGNGNGFKMGGEGLAPTTGEKDGEGNYLVGQHSIRNSISFANKKKGFDSNSSPNNAVNNCLSVYNGGQNFALYSYDGVTTGYSGSNNLSLLAGSSDQISESGQSVSMFADPTNYLCYVVDKKITTKNKSGAVLEPKNVLEGWTSDMKDIFDYLGVEISGTSDKTKYLSKGSIKDDVLPFITRDEYGSIVLKDGYLGLTSAVPAGVGAHLEKTPGSNYASIEFAGVTFDNAFYTSVDRTKLIGNDGTTVYDYLGIDDPNKQHVDPTDSSSAPAQSATAPSSAPASSEQKKGCSCAIGVSGAIFGLVTILGACLFVRKKENK